MEVSGQIRVPVALPPVPIEPEPVKWKVGRLPLNSPARCEYSFWDI